MRHSGTFVFTTDHREDGTEKGFRSRGAEKVGCFKPELLMLLFCERLKTCFKPTKSSPPDKLLESSL